MSGKSSTGFDSIRTILRTPFAATTALVLILAAGILIDSYLLFRSNVAVGLDGYYYVLQVDNLRNHGTLYFFSRTPLVFYLLTILTYLVGETVAAIKLGSIVIHTFLAFGVAELVRLSARSRWLGVSAAGLIVFSHLHLFSIAEFIKSMTSVMFIVWAAVAALQVSRTKSWRWGITSLACGIAAILSHGLAIPLMAAIVASAILAHVFLNYSKRQSQWWIALASLTVIWLTPVLLSAQHFVLLPQWLANELSTRPVSTILKFAIVERGLLLAAAVSAAVLLIWKRESLRANNLDLVCLTTIVLSFWLNLNPFFHSERGTLSLADRLNTLCYIQLAIILPGLFAWLLVIKRVLLPYAVAVVLPLLLLGNLSGFPVGLQREYLTARVALVDGLRREREQLGLTPLVIAPHGDEFVVTSTMGIPSQQRLPTNPVLYQSKYWLLHGVKRNDLDSSMKVVSTQPAGLFSVLLSDDELNSWLETLTTRDRQILFATNPHLREAYPQAS